MSLTNILILHFKELIISIQRIRTLEKNSRQENNDG